MSPRMQPTIPHRPDSNRSGLAPNDGQLRLVMASACRAMQGAGYRDAGHPSLINSGRNSRRVGFVPPRSTPMAETSLARLKALEAHLAALQKARAIGISEAATWRRLREELERIVPRPNRDPEPVRVLTDDLERKCAQTATAMAKERGVWEKLRAEIEASAREGPW